MFTREPESFNAGDTVEWIKEVSDYPASQGYSLVYYLRGPSSIDITATADGDNYKVFLSSSDTSNYTPGTYWWNAYIINGTERYKVDEGKIEIKPNLANLTSFDGRTHAEKVLEAINTILEGKTDDVEEYTIAGRNIKRMSVSELIKWRTFYIQEVKREKRAKELSKGFGIKNIKVRF